MVAFFEIENRLVGESVIYGDQSYALLQWRDIQERISSTLGTFVAFGLNKQHILSSPAPT